ncbi:Carboxylic ester hydrolase [Aphelenchoides fujianensis]|nr:Carboxylic ester hydrolase [Aphelenchoides fujianensis]
MIEGFSVESNGQTVDVFKGIPFVEPPLGELRFRAPRPPSAWSGVRNTSEYAPPCMSITLLTSSPQGPINEDCLYLNVFADQRCLEKKCPIFFFVHGARRAEVWRRPDENHPFLLSFYAYGPSGGASTVECLLASPAVEAGAISRAILISGAGSLRPHANRRLSRAVSREVNCTNEYPAEELACLRRTPARALSLAAQRSESEWIGIWPQTDGRLFTERSFGRQIERTWKPTPLLITDTTIENALLRRGRSMPRMCAWFFSAFGFEAAATAEECGRVYEATGAEEITRDAMHAFVVRMAAFNARRGQPAYLGLFAQVNHSKHADDLTYLIRLHSIARMTENDRLMDEWYPRMIKNFIKGGPPVEGECGEPVDGEGRGFYRMNFELEDGAKAGGERRFKERPHFVPDGVFDLPAVEFWNRHLQAVDDEARRTGGRKVGELLA